MSKEIPAAVEALSEKIAAGVSFVDGKIVIDPNTYVQTLPESITVEQVKALHDHNANFFPAAVHALKAPVLKAMKKDKDIEKLQGSFPLIGKDTFDVTIERKRDFPVIGSEGKTTTVYGNIKASLTTQAARANIGAFSAVKESLNNEFHAALAK